jgi:hypothetical protein
LTIDAQPPKNSMNRRLVASVAKRIDMVWSPCSWFWYFGSGERRRRERFFDRCGIVLWALGSAGTF